MLFFRHTIENLFGSCIIVREPGSGTREILERYLNERNCSISDFQRVIEVGSIRAIKSLVSANCGITFLYEAAAAQDLRDGTLRKIPLIDFERSNSFTIVRFCVLVRWSPPQTAMNFCSEKTL